MAYLQTAPENDGIAVTAAKSDSRKPRLRLRRPVTEEFLAFAPQKSAKDGNAVIALLKNQFARD
jgi:hypothetical protein